MYDIRRQTSQRTYTQDTVSSDQKGREYSETSAYDIASWLVAQIATRACIDPSEVDTRVPFSRYGLGSLATISISGDLERWLGRRLSPTLIYDYPSIESLAHYLAHGMPLVDTVVPIETHQGTTREPVAIIGLGCRFPGASNPEAFWQLLSQGVDAIREIPDERWKNAPVGDYHNPEGPGKLQTRWGGFLDHVDLFDPYFFGISPREAISMDPQQRLILEVAWEALEHAGQAPEKLAGSQTGVFIGISNSDYARLQPDPSDHVDLYTATGNALSVTSNRLSYLLDLRGPSVAVDTACSSSLVAVHLACHSLRVGESRLALAGGVNVILSPDLTIAFSHGQMMASDGRCKTFDARADGYVRSEGCGIVALKLLSNALQDGNQILAIVRGSAVNQDGRSNGFTAPRGPAQQAVIRQALHNAHVAPHQISYVEAHGTGTPLGDPIEIQALENVLSERNAEHGLCHVGSVKTNIGHLEAAAGIAGLIKVVLAFQHQQIPPHLHLKNLNPHIHFTKNCITIPTKSCAWPTEGKRRFAGVSSFGFGGTNAHVVLEEAPVCVTPEAKEDRPLHIIALSAKSDSVLRELADRYEKSLASRREQRIQDVCFTANTGRSHFSHRFATVVSSSEQLQEQLRSFILGGKLTSAWSGTVSTREQPKIAFLYTGQGSQYSGMGYHLYTTQPTFRKALDQCAEILRTYLKEPLLSLLSPESRTSLLLQQTQYAQPVLFALEYALTQLWRSWGIEPNAVLGHSLGEYIAACVAGVFSLEDGLKLVAERGKLMQSLDRKGKMAIVFADEHRVCHAIAPYQEQITLAALNGPKTTVISGTEESVQAVLLDLESKGVVAQFMESTHAFHSPLMEPILGAFVQVANQVRFPPPRRPLSSNVTGKQVQADFIPDAAYWRQPLREPVRFAERKSIH